MPTPDELREIIVGLLADGAGGEAKRWRDVVGKVRSLALAANVRSNWSVDPRGSEGELVVVQRAVKIVRAEHPHVSG